jgi:hypothetical protein
MYHLETPKVCTCGVTTPISALNPMADSFLQENLKKVTDLSADTFLQNESLSLDHTPGKFADFSANCSAELDSSHTPETINTESICSSLCDFHEITPFAISLDTPNLSPCSTKSEGVQIAQL